MDKKKAYEEKIQAQMDEWKSSFDKFKAKMKGSSADAKIKYSDSFSSLENKQVVLSRKMHELKDAGEDKWIDIKNNIDDMLRDMRDGLRKMT